MYICAAISFSQDYKQQEKFQLKKKGTKGTVSLYMQNRNFDYDQLPGFCYQSEWTASGVRAKHLTILHNIRTVQ